MTDTTLLARVQALLDARRDPLDDDAVIAALQAHPEWLDRVVRLRADARALAQLPITPIHRPRRWPWFVSAIVAAAWLVAILCRQPARPHAGRILSAHLEELRPRAHIAATFVINERLLSTRTTRLETWQTRSEVP